MTPISKRGGVLLGRGLPTYGRYQNL